MSGGVVKINQKLVDPAVGRNPTSRKSDRRGVPSQNHNPEIPQDQIRITSIIFYTLHKRNLDIFTVACTCDHAATQHTHCGCVEAHSQRSHEFRKVVQKYREIRVPFVKKRETNVFRLVLSTPSRLECIHTCASPSFTPVNPLILFIIFVRLFPC